MTTSEHPTFVPTNEVALNKSIPSKGLPIGNFSHLQLDQDNARKSYFGLFISGSGGRSLFLESLQKQNEKAN